MRNRKSVINHPSYGQVIVKSINEIPNDASHIYTWLFCGKGAPDNFDLYELYKLNDNYYLKVGVYTDLHTWSGYQSFIIIDNDFIQTVKANL